MIAEGLDLMVAGMGVVFGFLILMVLVMNASAKILPRFEKPVETAAGPGTASGDALAEVAVAIAAARRHIDS